MLNLRKGASSAIERDIAGKKGTAYPLAKEKERFPARRKKDGLRKAKAMFWRGEKGRGGGGSRNS